MLLVIKNKLNLFHVRLIYNINFKVQQTIAKKYVTLAEKSFENYISNYLYLKIYNKTGARLEHLPPVIGQGKLY